MRRPSFAAIFWFLAFVTALILFILRPNLFQQSLPRASDDMIFSLKAFTDNPQVFDGFVSISGTLTGENLSGTFTGNNIAKNNTVNVSCYKDRMECLAASINQIGSNQLGGLVSSMFPIITWNEYEVVATSGDSDCVRITVSLERKSETALWVEEPISQERCKNTENKVHKWTVENPPFWQSLQNKVRTRPERSPTEGTSN
jgi:hypothetical protein